MNVKMTKVVHSVSLDTGELLKETILEKENDVDVTQLVNFYRRDFKENYNKNVEKRGMQWQ